MALILFMMFGNYKKSFIHSKLTLIINTKVILL